MNDIKYISFAEVDPKALMKVVNEDSLRKHLINHPYFDKKSIVNWIEEKVENNAIHGCRVRVVSIGGSLAGWCGIQPDDYGYEIAIVISNRFWGSGLRIFNTLINWARELGHKEVHFHLLDTRREYKALAKLAANVHNTQIFGRNFKTFHFSITP